MSAVILHHHLFKNAGTTIDSVLFRNFGPAFVDHRDDLPMQQVADYLANYLSSNSHVRALSTHSLRPPLPQVDGLRVLTLLMCRSPLERPMSVYRFERCRPDADGLLAQQARQLSFRDFVAWAMQSENPSTLCNFHVVKLLPWGFDDPREFGGTEYDRAVATISAIPLLGLVDRFDESMVLFEHSLSRDWPGLDLSYRALNVSRCSSKQAGDAEGVLRRELGDKLFGEYVQRNAFDFRLIAVVRRLFDQRLAEVNDLDEKLQEFRRRCRKRQGLLRWTLPRSLRRPAPPSQPNSRQR